MYNSKTIDSNVLLNNLYNKTFDAPFYGAKTFFATALNFNLSVIQLLLRGAKN